MTTSLILTRSPAPSMAKAELTHLARAPIDMDRAKAQHTAYCAALADAGARVETLPALDDHPDCVFVEDTLLALPECFILTRPGAASRRGEVAHMASALPQDRPVLRLAEPALLDGGDVMILERRIYVGLSSRTTPDGAAALAGLVAPYGYEVVPVHLADALHLKTAVTALAEDLLLINPAWISRDTFPGFRFIETAAEEPFAANHLSLNGRIFMAAAHPETAGRITGAGFDVQMLEVDEFAKAEGGLTCMSLVIPTTAGSG